METWFAVLEAAGIPAGPVLRYDETRRDEQLTSREMIMEMNQPLMGRPRTLGQPDQQAPDQEDSQ